MIGKKCKVLAAAMCLSLAVSACSSESPESEATTAATTTAETSETEESTETPTEESTEASSAETTIEIVDNSFRFTTDNFPVFDGSTATKPLAIGIGTLLTGNPRETFESSMQFHRTDDAFYYLMDGTADILVVAQPCQDIYDQMEEAGFEYEMEPIAMEGLVFIVNETNPVESLTIEQVQDIYSGKITNWSEVGGLDQPIVPLQRTETSGSQVMMRECVMKDIPLMEVPTTMIPTEMGDLIEAVASFDNSSSNALGYTVYYYADSMGMADGLKILKINDVEPSNDSIASGEYPFTNPYFCVVPSGLENTDGAKIIYDWLVSEEGQKLVEAEGYVPVA